MITSLTATPIGTNVYELAFASDLTPPVTFYIYRNGVLIAETLADTYIVTVEPGESPVFEVFDELTSAPTATYPEYAILAWTASAGATTYRVAELVGATWTTRATLAPLTDQTYFVWRSRSLADSTTHQFRVTPIGENGNDGTPTTHSLLMVRIPDPPAADFTYDPLTGEVTVSAA